jgi:Uri superfamily endonuclease
MNQFDRDNLEWYLGISDEDREAWAEDMGLEHVDYMLKVLRTARAEMMCALYDEMESELNPKFSQARRVIKRIGSL